jgi:hypothetical protein
MSNSSVAGFNQIAGLQGSVGCGFGGGGSFFGMVSRNFSGDEVD